ncbi:MULTISPECIES: hypothetical protein [Acetobacter]|uniref:Uncharacterized protein n=2 Tax=Acetobacter TaxID=434 RepID=A0AAN1UA39_9PROT|nr:MULTISPECIES: hypothetical protein [Acetobacter]ASL39321.1 hypothetical protein CBI36_01915 [Acetobacter oryzifermentans]AXN01448.1 hypothetical protein CJF59_13480 [Acetobacter pomorum]KAA8387615.1 hypothetical protein FKW31_02930 [Acetobacter sp. DmW_136]KAA8397159.1 hypothetical protein FKW22_05155 [Acetobacter sp. DmW_125124]KAA8397705.1 hypothetical protein FKW20_08585 [Acetobacter sp. DmW_125127]
MTDTQGSAPAQPSAKTAVVPATPKQGGTLYRVTQPGYGYAVGATISDPNEIKKHGVDIRRFAVPVGGV